MNHIMKHILSKVLISSQHTCQPSLTYNTMGAKL